MAFGTAERIEEEKPVDIDVLRTQLIAQVEGGQAYSPVEKIVRGFPVQLTGERAGSIGHTAWELLEHLRIAQWDILQFTLDPEHITPDWPGDHWPKTEAPPDETAWEKSVSAFLGDLESVKDLARNPETDLAARIQHGTGQTYLREILLVADHNAYHLGQLMQLQRALERERSG